MFFAKCAWLFNQKAVGVATSMVLSTDYSLYMKYGMLWSVVAGLTQRTDPKYKKKIGSKSRNIAPVQLRYRCTYIRTGTVLL